MNSEKYIAAKLSGLCVALSVNCPDIAITGFSVNTRRLSAAVRQLLDTIFTVHSVTTNFTVQVANVIAGETVSTAIEGAADAIKTETDSVMEATDWSTDSVISGAPTMTTPNMGTPVVTVVPTPAPTMGSVSGVGDPHLTNMYGQRFDLYRTGVSVLLQIPGNVGPQHALLRLEADARRMGTCSDVYFQTLNISGTWTKHSDRLVFFATADKKSNSMTWMRFGKIDLKVVSGRTREGVRYLNVFARHLGKTGFPVGGLLGEDDHEVAMTPPTECAHPHQMTLMARGASLGWVPFVVSVAEASFE